MEKNVTEGQENTLTLQEFSQNIDTELVYVTKLNAKQELKSCSYAKGYITQEVYRCITCFNENGEMAGICSGCAFVCHKDHEVENLYFKRNFRCDCGNSKYSK